jgi:hypothetical protein
MACKIMLHLQINYYLRVATIVATMGVLDKKENSLGIVSVEAIMSVTTS